MSNTFFNQLETSDWEPPSYPELDNDEWETRFENGSAKVKSNIANSWMWLLNKSLAGGGLKEAKNAKLRDMIELHSRWIRSIHPYINKSFFEVSFFDGSVESLLKRFTQSPGSLAGSHGKWSGDDIEHPSMILFAKYVTDLWYGEKDERLAAIASIRDLMDELIPNHRWIPRLGNLVQNLAWDVVHEYKAPSTYRAHAARLSIYSGLSQHNVPNHESLENIAWHALAKERLSTKHPTEVEGYDILSTIRYGCSDVATANLPYLVKMVRFERDGDPYFAKRSPLLCAISKPPEKITDFDIMRLWVPEKTAIWDTAESLDLSLEEASESTQVKDKLTQVSPQLPQDISNDDPVFEL